MPRPAVWAAWTGGITLAAVAALGALDEPRPAERVYRTDTTDVALWRGTPADPLKDMSSAEDMSHWALPTRMPEPPRPPTEAPIPVGGELIWSDDKRMIFEGDHGERARITLVRVGDPKPGRDPAAPGVSGIDPASRDRMITVEVKVENIGLIRLRTDVEENVWLLDDQYNEYEYDRDRTASAAAGQPGLLDPGATLTRLVIFKVDRSVTGLRAQVG
ncbi:hypothetical protein [Actinoplanes sp. NPDC026670]|uniref:hypothetical protein n=1 Tax=Actinoplanes sp. NPDC026670 TaxID=3154700 RepID=UPI0033EA726D